MLSAVRERGGRHRQLPACDIQPVVEATENVAAEQAGAVHPYQARQGFGVEANVSLAQTKALADEAKFASLAEADRRAGIE